VRYVKLTFGLAVLGALVGLVLAAIAASTSSTDDIVSFSFGELAPWLTFTGFVLGGAVGALSSGVWASCRWIARRHRRSPAI
jgi:hypothetical protein